MQDTVFLTQSFLHWVDLGTKVFPSAQIDFIENALRPLLVSVSSYMQWGSKFPLTDLPERGEMRKHLRKCSVNPEEL